MAAAQVALRATQRLPAALRVTWEDGMTAQFTYVWLRDNSEKRPSLTHLDLHARPEEVDCSNRHALSVIWPPFLSSRYSSQFLREHSRVVRPAASLACPITKKVLTVPWCVLDAMPANDLFVKGATGSVQWGDTCHEAGTVWPQLERVPSVCTVETEHPGAKVNLVDAVSALSLFSATHPEQFRFLASAPIQYEADIFSASHYLATIQDGRVVAAVFNNELRSADITVDSLEMYYKCLKTFHRICLDTMHTVILEPGTVLVVDNSQTLLGAPAQAGRKLRLNIYG